MKKLNIIINYFKLFINIEHQKTNSKNQQPNKLQIPKKQIPKVQISNFKKITNSKLQNPNS